MQPKGGVMAAVRPANSTERLPAPQVDQRLTRQTGDASVPQGKHINHSIPILAVYPTLNGISCSQLVSCRCVH